MTAKYEVIGNTTLTSSAASVTFSSIPGGYKDLVLTMDFKAASSAAGVYTRFNNDSSSTYTMVRMVGTTSGTASSVANQVGSFDFQGVSSQLDPTTIRIQIMDYSATDKHTSILVRSDRASNNAYAGAGRYPQTTAISQIEFFATQNFAAGSTFRLLGVN